MIPTIGRPANGSRARLKIALKADNIIDMLPIHYIPIALVALAGAGTALHFSMMTAAQPMRTLLAERGEKLLGRRDLPQEVRRDVEAMLDDAFPCSCIALFVIIPFVPLMVLYGLRDSRARVDATRALTDAVKGQYLEVQALHRRIQATNHPLLTPIIRFVAALSLAVFAPFYLIGGHNKKVAFDQDSTMVGLELQHQAIHNRLRSIPGMDMLVG